MTYSHSQKTTAPKKSNNRPVLDLVDTLRNSGYKTGLLSNNTLEAAEMMRGEGINTHFDAFIVSAEVGMMKPDPSIYALLCQQLSVQPSELIFIDDSKKSLSTAEECGFTPVLFTDYESLVRDLKRLSAL